MAGDYHPSRRMDGLDRLEQIDLSKLKKQIVLPGDDTPEDPDIVLEDVSVSEITATTLADHQADRSSFRKELAEGTQDLGEGFLMSEEPVIVSRDQTTKRITRVTPVSEIPGVEYTRGRLEWEGTEEKVKEAEAKETLHPVSRDQRHKLVSIMAARLLRHYEKLADDYPGFNPLRDGIPTLPAGSPEHLEPQPGTPLYPATKGQVFEYLKGVVGQRATFINKQRFGSGHSGDLSDLTIRIK